MTSTVFNLQAELEDGTSFKVTADQRDIAAFECEPFGVSFFLIQTRPLTAIRYLAWYAGRRQKLHTVQKWEDWENVCLRVEDIDAEGVEAPEADPGQSAASAGT